MSELESQALAAADEILVHHGTTFELDKLRLVLALGWTQGYGAGIAAGKEIADEAFENLKARMAS